MKIVNDLYTYEIKEEKLSRILKRINKLKPVKSLYVVVFPLFGDGILEIYSYNQLLQPYYKKRTDDIEIIGISKDRHGANCILLDLIQEMCDSGYTGFDGTAGNIENDIRKFVE